MVIFKRLKFILIFGFLIAIISTNLASRVNASHVNGSDGATGLQSVNFQCVNGVAQATFRWSLLQGGPAIQRVWLDIATEPGFSQYDVTWWGLPMIANHDDPFNLPGVPSTGLATRTNGTWTYTWRGFHINQDSPMYWRIQTHRVTDDDNSGSGDGGRAFGHRAGGPAFSTQICPPPTHPDLITYEFHHTPQGELEGGQQIYFAARTRNRGDGPAGPSVTRYLLDIGNTGNFDLSWSRNIPSLSPGANQPTSTGGDPWTVQEGSHRAVVCADRENQVAESDEGNNCSEIIFTVRPPPIPPANLCELYKYFQRILGVLSALFGFAFLAMIIVGGFRYLTSGGEPKATAAARNVLTYAVIGLILMIVAWLVLLLIQTIFRVNPDIRIFQFCPF